MFEEVRIRERKSVKYGKTYEYRFETAPVNGERKWLSKGGYFLKLGSNNFIIFLENSGHKEKSNV